MEYEVVVVGAGPAGSAAAQRLAEKGIKTALVERKFLPRHKTCAGAVSGKALPYLGEGFLHLTEDRLTGMVFRYRYRDQVGYRTDAPYAYTVTRDRFDHHLAVRAVQAGAELIEGQEVKCITREGGWFMVSTEKATLKARAVVGADGAGSLVARTFGLARKFLGVAVEALVPLEKVRDHEVYRETVFLDYGFIPKGYAWIFPKSDHLNVGLGTFSARSVPVKFLLEQYLDRCFPYLEQRDRKDLSWSGHPIPVYRGGRFSGDGVLVVGDAAGLLDPFFGEGIHFALESSLLAVGVIERYLEGGASLGEYDRRLDEKILRQFQVAHKVAWLFYHLTGAVHRHLVRKGRIIREFTALVTGKQSYHSFGRWLRHNILKEALSRVPDDDHFLRPGE